MTSKQSWTRRQFSQALTLSAAGAMLVRPTFAHPVSGPAGLAFAGTATSDGKGAIHVFRVSALGWQSIQTLPAVAPGHLLLHPVLPVLYTLHDVAQWDHLPRGAVSTYAIDTASGHLTLRGTHPLSLGAIHPRHATLTASGAHLLVAAERGGVYNLLPVGADGELLPVSAIRKELGLGDGDRAKIASPRSVASLRDGRLLAIDAGQESLTSFLIEGTSLAVQRRVRVHAGDGPAQLAVAPGGTHAYTLSAAGDSVAVHALRPGGHLDTLQTLQVTPGRKALLAVPSGNFLLAAGDNSTEVLRIAFGTGRLSRHTTVRSEGQLLSFAADGHVLSHNPATGEFQQAIFDRTNGTTIASKTVAQLGDCVSLVFRSLAVEPFVGRLA